MIVSFLLSFTVLAVWGAGALGIVVGTVALSDWAHELVTGEPWLR